GDPTLGSTSLEDTPDWEVLLSTWGDQVEAKGIKAVTGSVVGDGSYFDSYGAVASWQWADIGNYYGSDARGLNFNENKYTLYFDRNTQIGRTPRIVRLEPEIPWIEWVNEVKLAGPRTGDQAYIYGGPYTYLKYVRGTIPIGRGLFDIDGAIPDPPMVAARCFRLALERKGITIGKGEGVIGGAVKGANRKTLFKHTSPPLSVIVDRTNQKSVNLYAEALIKLLGKRLGKEGVTQKGTDILLDYWSERGVSIDGIQLYDGSGLSTRNSVTARFLADVLRKVSLDQKTFPGFLSSIPKAGRTGSLRAKFKGSAAEDNLYAKSGTLGGVRSYAGYFTGKDGRLYAFAVLVNHYTSSGGSMRIKLDRLLTSFCE
ncbi:MAG: D-alanyl-D-alanine carboxypeptidase/D-alanyl-D-alanine-endopeptidase, partial [Saprospiraceae bacterium]|nr:D-alanyl-D-alanine carboxypeptidase/D-alanyl-D-alanine-endopeptidase [Saprospiraceae bacterium]